MKPNNYYYRHIAIKRGYNWDEKFHSSYYFMRKIAESYGYTYTTRKPSNKFLRDFCTSEAEHTPETFEYNVYYLYKIAKKLYPSTEAGKTENYYLKIICENIGGDTPVATDITWTLNGADEGESAILSHADGDDAVFVFTVTDENESPVSGYQIPIEVDGVAVSPTPVTDANGQATYTYESSGAGDVAIDVDCTLLTKTFSIIDAWKYIASGSQTFSATHTQIPIADLNDLTGDYEISVTMKSSAQKGFGIALNNATATSNENLFRIGVNSGNVTSIVRMGNGSVAEGYDSTTTYTVNTDVVLKLQRVNGVYTAYIDSYNHSYSNAPSNPRYLQLESWTSSKTLTYTDFIVKPL